MRIIKTITAFFFILLLCCLSLWLGGYSLYVREGESSKQQNIVIPHETTRDLIKLLQSKNILNKGSYNALFFRIMVYLTKSQGVLHSAELSFPAHVSIQKTLDILRHGHAVSHSLTIPEGVTAQEISDIFSKAEGLNGPIIGFKEGRFFPQTYFYQWGMRASDIINQAQNLMKIKLQMIWENRDQNALKDNIKTPEELLILASLIEKETAVSSERSLIARVFLNRLEKNMKLQTDPTVIYAITEGRGHLMRKLSHEDLKIHSSYNTYEIEGLPPTPICAPSEESLYAAAHPAEGSMLYFVASGEGGHLFADSLAEQNEHIRFYHQFQKRNLKR